MEFENYAKRINSVKEIENYCQNQPEKQKQNRFAIKENKMILKEIEKSKFLQINDKRYYFSDRIVSFPFFHPLLHEIIHFRKEKKQTIKSYLQEEKHKFLQIEKFPAKKNARILLYRSILQQKPTFFHLDNLWKD